MKEIDRKILVANILEEGRVGGPQIRVALVASMLDQKIDTTVIFPKKNSKEFQIRCQELGLKYLLVHLTTMSSNWILMVKYIIFSPFEVLMLSWILKKNRFDIVHVSGGSWQYKGILAAKLARIRVVWELNDTYTPYGIRVIFFFLSFLADGFIFASKRTKEYYKKIIPIKRQSFLIQSPVDVTFFDPALRYTFDKFIKKIIKKKKIVIGTIANVNPTKGFATYLKTVQKLSFYSNKIIFIVIGSVYESQKKYFTHLVEFIKKAGIKNFFFLGSRKDVRPYLKIMDIYVCTSDNESSPLSVWEAMSMEKAIISTNVGDVGCFIRDGFNGFLIKVRDSDCLADRIVKLIRNPKLRDTYGKSVRNTAKSKLDLKICSKLHVEAYQAIINK